jgi:hypothetical protein
VNLQAGTFQRTRQGDEKALHIVFAEVFVEMEISQRERRPAGWVFRLSINVLTDRR